MDESYMPFEDWLSETVMVVLNNGDSPAGRLEEVTEVGIIVRAEQGIWWTPIENEADDEGFIRSKHVSRVVSNFHPWTAIYSVRVLEPDEAVERGF
jgi:hypothetical protein